MQNKAIIPAGTRFVVFDTEGSGLFKFKDEATGKPIPADDPCQPRLASFDAILLDEEFNEIERLGRLVKPDGWVMSAEATAVNGLTDEKLMAEGVPVAEVLDIFAQMVKEGFAFAAYNAQHDLKHMRAELRRAGRDDLFIHTRNVCLMRKARGIIQRVDGRTQYQPSLDDCRSFLNLSHEGKHTSRRDTEDALAVFNYLRTQPAVDLTPEVHFAKQAPAAKAPAKSRAKPKADDRPLAEQDIPE